MAERYLCIHAHFYQPPRENPWLETVEMQDSAYPFHDWNERITAECYASNASSRILTADNRIAQIVSNYSKISFNFGPTLLSWLEANAPEVYAAILEADRASAEKFSGHGSAMAQVYNHMILPLASPQDRQTQVLWGVRDFEHRFGRRPEGMWLAETAADIPTLEALAEAGIRFTILAPHQAARVRPIAGASADGANRNGNQPSGEAEWNDVSGGRIDTSRAYVQRLPSGRSINLFFYDGPTSRAVAFEGLLNNGEAFASRLLAAFDGGREGPQLEHISTDGETYGHHHRHGDMALAYALHHVESKQLARLTNYGEFLELHPPEHEVGIAESTSWSCAHGVERWKSDCGCNTGGRAGWNQAWRGPLRAALDWLRDALAPLYAQAAGELLRDPWAARNDYIEVVLDRTPEGVARFFSRHARRQLTPSERVRALKLLEMQRHTLLMYTSCGWFFDELSGLESVQVVEYAGRAVQLAQELFSDGLEEQFLTRLAEARSNLPEMGDGRRIYEMLVRTSTIDLPKVAAHFAISSMFKRTAEGAPTYCYSVARMDYHPLEAGRARLALGRALVTSRITEESAFLTFAVLHFGDHNLSAGVRPATTDEHFAELAREASEVFQRDDLPGTVRVLDRHFAGVSYSLKSLFRDEQRRIVDTIVTSVLREAESTYRGVYEHHAPLVRFLGELHLPVPPVLRASAEFVINASLRREFSRSDPDLDRVTALLGSAARDHVALDAAGLGFALKKTLEEAFAGLLAAPTDLELLHRLDAQISMARSLPFEVDLWRVQNIYNQLLLTVYPGVRQLGNDEAVAWSTRFETLGEKLGFALQAAPTERLSPVSDQA